KAGRGGDLLPAHEGGNDRNPGGLVDGEEALLHREESKQGPHGAASDRCKGPESRRRENHAGGGDVEQGPAVHAVCKGATVESEDDQRDEAAEAGKPYVGGAAGQRVDVRRNSDDIQLRTNNG